MAARTTSLALPVAALATAVVVPVVVSVGEPSLAVPNPTSTVFINELHYDNASTDVGEAIEIAAPAGTDLAGWSIVLYNGATGETYNTRVLAGVVADQGGGAGTLAFTYPTDGIQNGSMDGIALIGPGNTVVQFLSYEGTLTAGNGPAVGATSTDIGVSEASTQPAGLSLQVTGTGTAYGDFTWSAPATASFGAINAGQTFSTTGTTTTSSSSSTSSTTTTTTLPPGPCAAPQAVTPISTIQGLTDVSPCAGQTVLIDGVVVGDYEGASPTLRGFYVQEQDADRDNDPATSDGIFVFNGSNNLVALGDVVQVRGPVGEFQGQTQVSAQTIMPVGTGATVTAAEADLPVPAADHFERFEGMLASFEEELTVTEHFQLGRFGQIVVSSGGRLFQPSTVAEPGAPARAVAAANALNRVIVDDALQNQNPDPILFGRGGQPLSAANTLRGGDTVTGLVGVMTYTWAGNAASGNAYRVRPINDLSDTVPGGGVPNFQPANPRPTAAPDVGGSLRIANFNVLNYFLTLNDGGNDCGPDGNKQECRGAETAVELERQRTKLLAALAKLDADIVGLIELENTPNVDPLGDIVARLNARGEDDYAAIDTGTIGTDAIRVGIIYKPRAVSPIGGWAIIDESVDTRFNTRRNRPSLAQSFVETEAGEIVTVVVNHLKSKNCGGETGGDVDDGDGHGCFNATRKAAAEALRDWVAADPTDVADDDVLLLGDMNSNAMEDPIDVFVEAGFTDLAASFGATYSFVFDGQWGSLDYAMATPSLAPQATGSADYHINSDEPAVLDYNTNFKSGGQLISLFAPDEFRTSDHDPVVSGFALDSLSIDEAVIVLRRSGGGSVALSGSAEGDFTACPRLALRVDGFPVVDVQTVRVGRTTICLSLTNRGLLTFDIRSGSIAAALTLPAAFTLADNTVEFGLAVDGADRLIVRTGRRVGQVWIAD